MSFYNLLFCLLAGVLALPSAYAQPDPFVSELNQKAKGAEERKAAAEARKAKAEKQLRSAEQLELKKKGEAKAAVKEQRRVCLELLAAYKNALANRQEELAANQAAWKAERQAKRAEFFANNPGKRHPPEPVDHVTEQEQEDPNPLGLSTAQQVRLQNCEAMLEQKD